MAFDYDEFTGKLINKYTKIKLENYTKSVLQSFVGTLIEKYNIKKIDYVKATNAEEIDVFIYFSIKYKRLLSIASIYETGFRKVYTRPSNSNLDSRGIASVLNMLSINNDIDCSNKLYITHLLRSFISLVHSSDQYISL